MSLKPYTIKVESWLVAGQVFVMADTSHPEVDLLTPIHEAERIVIVCHPDDEQMVRDVLAREEETPKWWRDQQAVENAIEQISRDIQRHEGR